MIDGKIKYSLKPGEWNKQYQRMMRYYRHFENIGSGTVQIGRLDAEDIAISFFQNCHHLKEWLLKDSSSGKFVPDIEENINSSRHLSLCADIANGSKHLKLNRNQRSKVVQKVQRLNYHHVLEIRSDSEEVKHSLKSITWTVVTDKENIDGFRLATDCINDWRTYLKDKGLIIELRG